MADAAPAPTPAPAPVPPPAPREILYCAICTAPPEYCEFSSTQSKCKTWLEDNHPGLFSKYWSDEAISSKMAALSTEAKEKLEAEAAKKEAKAEAKAEREMQKRKASKIIIKRIERTKRKHVTAIFGLDNFNVDLKKCAKTLASRFATGASVAKNAQGLDEIVVQGDVAEEVLEMIEKQEKAFAGVPKENAEIIEDKKKKAPA